MKLEADSYLYRSYLAQQKYVIVQNELREKCHAYLEPLKLLVEYFLAGDKSHVVKKLDDILSKDIDATNHLLFIAAAVIYSNEQNYEAALQILHQGDNLEW